MTEAELCFLSACDLVAAIRARQLSPVALTEGVLAQIEQCNPVLNAFCAVAAEQALQQARAAEQAVMRGDDLGPLHGLPVSVKDLIATRAMPTRRGSRLFADAIPEDDAPVVQRLRAAGAIIIGKTSTPEFGFKGVTDSPLTGVTRNPWHLERTPGGSSGGAAAALAAGMGPLAIGTDGSGSIRIPASFCGVYGLKPHAGRVPVYPPHPAGELAHIGPMARTVRDAALLLAVIAGPDDRDRFSLPAVDVDYRAAAESRLGPLRLAWSPDLGYAQVEPEVRRITAQAAAVFAELGCVVEQIDAALPSPERIMQRLFYVSLAVMLEQYPGYQEVIDPQLLDILSEVRGLSAEDYVGTVLERNAYCLKLQRIFVDYDLLLCPSVAVAPFQIGSEGPRQINGLVVSRRAWFALTPPFNFSGQPAASIPCGFTGEGLPVGLQIVGRRFDEATVLRASAAFEAARPWAHLHPPLG